MIVVMYHDQLCSGKTGSVPKIESGPNDWFTCLNILAVAVYMYQSTYMHACLSMRLYYIYIVHISGRDPDSIFASFEMGFLSLDNKVRGNIGSL